MFVEQGYSHNAPVLALSWSSDGTKLFSGGCDNVLSLCSVLDKSVTQVGLDAPMRLKDHPLMEFLDV